MVLADDAVAGDRTVDAGLVVRRQVRVVELPGGRLGRLRRTDVRELEPDRADPQAQGTDDEADSKERQRSLDDRERSVGSSVPRPSVATTVNESAGGRLCEEKGVG